MPAMEQATSVRRFPLARQPRQPRQPRRCDGQLPAELRNERTEPSEHGPLTSRADHDDGSLDDDDDDDDGSGRSARLICLSLSPSAPSPPPPPLCEAPKRRQDMRRCSLAPGWQHRRHLFGWLVASLLLGALLDEAARPLNMLRRRRRGRDNTINASDAILSQFVRLAEAASDQLDGQQQGGHSNNDNANDNKPPPLLVDTKYWVRNLEFGQRDNWRAQLKPCTLIERIAIQEPGAVVSMGDSLDALGGVNLESANIRDLILSRDGVLLLEEDTISAGSLDPLFIQFLNASGDCFDSASVAAAVAGDDNNIGSQQQPHLFEFGPEPNSMSWFNPENWYSALNANGGDDFGQMIDHLVPDSHRIPCSEDVVVFGNLHMAALTSLLQGDERAKIVPFKVNFRSAEGEPARNLMASLTASLRVSKLKIDERSYTQDEFNRLNAMYGNRLFDLLDDKSVFFNSRGQPSGADGRQDVLLIDESSIHHAGESSIELCHDEAGCMCGNEQPEVMDLICSFEQPLIEPAHLPCRDPIQVTGYCNKICATSLMILMEPSKFQESFLMNDLSNIQEGERDMGSLGEHVFVGARRVDHNRYEIVLRLAAADDQTYEQTLGLEMEIAKRIKRTLERAATKSFYGIRSISIRSSTDWRRNNQRAILWTTFMVLGCLFTLLFAHNDQLLTIQPLETVWVGINQFSRRDANVDSSSGYPQDACGLEEPIMMDEDQVTGGLTEPKTTTGANLALVMIDTCSITDSTHNLIDPND